MWREGKCRLMTVDEGVFRGNGVEIFNANISCFHQVMALFYCVRWIVDVMKVTSNVVFWASKLWLRSMCTMVCRGRVLRMFVGMLSVLQTVSSDILVNHIRSAHVVSGWRRVEFVRCRRFLCAMSEWSGRWWLTLWCNFASVYGWVCDLVWPGCNCWVGDGCRIRVLPYSRSIFVCLRCR